MHVKDTHSLDEFKQCLFNCLCFSIDRVTLLPENYRESEAPFADTLQAIFAILFFIIWGADSFWLKRTTYLSAYVPAIIRTSLLVLLTFMGGYLTWKAHEEIFGTVRSEAELIDHGVYRLTRHPMYLGIMIIYLGLTLSSISLASLIFLVIIFRFYNYLAVYEETKLKGFFGEEYLGYMNKVRRWI
jgi:protein-S-isoprenylcysteine O-methyltransferase Ste14